MLNIARGAALQISDSRTIFSFPAVFNRFGTETIFGIPIIFIMALALVILGSFVLGKTVFGRMLYAIGNNEEAVRLSGHNTSGYKIAAFTLCGACVGVAGIMYMLRLNMASPILGVGFDPGVVNAYCEVAVKHHFDTIDTIDIMDVNAEAVADTFRKTGVDILLHGHTHRPAVHSLEVGGRSVTRIVLGDWYDQGSVLRWDADGTGSLFVQRRAMGFNEDPELEAGDPLVRIGPDGVTLIAPHTDLGQGVRSVQAALIAEELDVGLSAVKMRIKRAREEFQGARRYGREFAFLMLDLDHFKKVNDQHGHLMGDEVLRGVAARVRSAIRDFDAAGRYGGEEFLLVLENTSMHTAQQVAERVRRRVANGPIHFQKLSVEITVSQGVSEARPGDDSEALIQRADQALYQAKLSGRNCVAVG